MSVAQFLDAVLPTQGHRFALCSFGEQGDPDFRPGQKDFPVGNTSEILTYANWGTQRGANVFFAVAGFAMNPGSIEDGGGARRLATCALWHRCIRLDVDVGAKGYPDKRDALVAILGMQAHYGMLAPWLVDSGGGIHVYWAFDRDVTLQEWMPMASRLRAACDAFGLKADSTTTTDAARILRVPGYPNNKPKYGATPPMVRILQVGASVAPEQVVMSLPAGDQIRLPVPAALRGMQSELQANMHLPYFLASTVATCPAMNAMCNDGGQRAQEPLWKAALDLINKSDDDESTKVQYARMISAGHRDFTEDGFQRKWAQVIQQDYHPPTCGRMAAAGAPECGGCPYRGKISSPLTLGRPNAPAAPSEPSSQPLPAPVEDPPSASATTASVPPPPAPSVALVAAPPAQVGVFVLDGSTVVKIVDGRLTPRLMIANGLPTQIIDTAPDDQGVKKQYNKVILDYKLVSVERMLDAVVERSVVVLTFERGKDGLCQIEFDNRDFAEPKSFFNKLNAKGLYCDRKSGADFVDKFMTEFLTQLQRARAASQIAGRCGWSADLNQFVLGGRVYNRDGSNEHIRTSIAPGEMDGYHTAGDYDRWRAAFDVVISGGPDRQAVLALAIAGPLMVFTGLDGVLLNAYSPESGVGKSTLCDAALSLWGAPNVLRKDFRDTANATFKLASVVGNMPMVIDEFTNVEGKALSDYVYTITQGREKHRLGADSKLATTGTTARWCLAAIATSNNSVHDKLQAFRADSSAEAARVFEMRMHPLNLPAETMGVMKQKLQALRSDYGFVGPQLVQLYMSKPPEFWRHAVMSRIGVWDREVSVGAGDRFRSAVCALIEVGAQLGVAMGMAFEPDAITAELKRHWLRQVESFESERKGPADFVNGYIVSKIAEFAMIGGINGDQIINPTVPKRFTGELRGKTVNGKWVAQTVMIPLDFIRAWVREQNGNYKAVREWMDVDPSIARHGRLMYLDGTVSKMNTPAVEFHYNAIMGRAALTALADIAPIPLEQTA